MKPSIGKVIGCFLLIFSMTLLGDGDYSGNEITIRKGDSLLLMANDTKKNKGKGKKNGLVKIDADADGKQYFHCAPEVGNPYQYNTVGTFITTATVRGKFSGMITWSYKYQTHIHPYAMIWRESLKSGPCHTISIYQNNIQVVK